MNIQDRWFQSGIVAGRKQGATHLRKMAADFLQMAEQTERSCPVRGHLLRTVALATAAKHKEKAELLNAQAAIIEYGDMLK